MSFLRNHQIKVLAEKAAEYAMAEVSSFYERADLATQEFGVKGGPRPTENEVLQLLYNLFLKKKGMPPKYQPQDKAYITLIMYVTELVNVQISVVGDKDANLITETVLSYLKNKTR